jgi:hypothetical protein
MADSKAGSVRSAALERMRLMWRHLIRDVAYGMNVVCHLFTFCVLFSTFHVVRWIGVTFVGMRQMRLRFMCEVA